MTMSADQGAIAEVGSPVLIPPAAVDGEHPWRWMTTAIAVATAALLVLNARTVDDWAVELAPNRLTVLLRVPTSGWAGMAERTGLDAPRAHLHATWTRVRAARFGKEQPGEQGAAAAEAN